MKRSIAAAFATDFLKRPSYEFIEVRDNLRLPDIPTESLSNTR
jgi:hypothetical protein